MELIYRYPTDQTSLFLSPGIMRLICKTESNNIPHFTDISSHLIVGPRKWRRWTVVTGGRVRGRGDIGRGRGRFDAGPVVHGRGRGRGRLTAAPICIMSGRRPAGIPAILSRGAAPVPPSPPTLPEILGHVRGSSLSSGGGGTGVITATWSDRQSRAA